MSSSMIAATTSRGALWFMMLAGPIAWSVRFLAALFLVPVACAMGSNLILHAVTLATAALTLAATLLAWRAWGRLRGGGPDPGVGGRSTFMALYGVMSGLFFLFVILVEGSMALALDACA